MKAADVFTAVAALPEAGIESILAGRRPLILAPHPDDETLGCGGFIAAACEIGLSPIVAILTDGTKSHPDSPSFPAPRLRDLREAEALRAVSLLGLHAKNLFFLRYEDTNLPASGDGFADAVSRVLTLARAQNCTLVIAPWAHDPHCDHEAAAAIAAATGLPVLSYPIWGWLRDDSDDVAAPNGGFRLKIAPFMARKQAAIAAHESQYGDLIHDSPKGFRLPANLLKIFTRPHETFIA